MSVEVQTIREALVACESAREIFPEDQTDPDILILHSGFLATRERKIHEATVITPAEPFAEVRLWHSRPSRLLGAKAAGWCSVTQPGNDSLGLKTSPRELLKIISRAKTALHLPEQLAFSPASPEIILPPAESVVQSLNELCATMDEAAMPPNSIEATYLYNGRNASLRIFADPRQYDSYQVLTEGMAWNSHRAAIQFLLSRGSDGETRGHAIQINGDKSFTLSETELEKATLELQAMLNAPLLASRRRDGADSPYRNIRPGGNTELGLRGLQATRFKDAIDRVARCPKFETLSPGELLVVEPTKPECNFSQIRISRGRWNLRQTSITRIVQKDGTIIHVDTLRRPFGDTATYVHFFQQTDDIEKEKGILTPKQRSDLLAAIEAQSSHDYILTERTTSSD